MKKPITEIVELFYTLTILFFLIIVLLRGLNILLLPINYQLFVIILPLLAVPTLLRIKPSDEKGLSIAPFIMVIAFLFALAIRLLPSTRSSIPLGYDPGFYKYTMELYVNALPQIPEAELASWVKEMYPQGLFILSDAMHILAGTDAMNHISYLFPFLGALLVLPIFAVTKSLFGLKVGVIASLLYAVSYTQYTAFTMLYFKNVIGLMLLLLAIYGLEKKRDGLMALMFAALGIFHRPEFLLFALILIPYFILHRRRGIILAIIGTALLIVPFWISRWEIYLGVVSEGIEGTFFGFDTYTMVSLVYLPFAAIGAVHLVINRRLNSILFYFLITCSIVVFQLVFFNRFIIMLDLAVIILAAVGIEHSLLQQKRVWGIVGATAIFLMVAASGVLTVTQANDVRPRIDEEQLQAIEWISENAEDSAYVLATSSDAPWVLGWSERRVIAPGLFEWYIQSKEEWFNFFDSTDPEVAKEFLDVYDSPVYVYCSRNSKDYLGLEKFEGDYFQQVYKSDGAVVYKYIGDG